MYDFPRGAKTTGSKFYFNTGVTAIDEWNLITGMINFHMERGYTFVIPPYLVNETTATYAGIYPKFKDQYYGVDNLVLIPTAETPLVGMHADEIIPEADLPLKYVAFSPCFRREAGAAGKRDKGLRRVHQFHKVELFVICKPEDSERLHIEMLHQVEEYLMSLHKELEYRVIALSAEDRAPWSNRTFDIEIACEGDWLEVSSISNTGDNQSKLAQIRYKPTKGGKPIKCHLLNGSGLALPRLVLAIDATLKTSS